MNSIYVKEKYNQTLNCLYKATVTQMGRSYEVTIYLDGYLLQTGEVFDSIPDAVVYIVLLLDNLCE